MEFCSPVRQLVNHPYRQLQCISASKQEFSSLNARWLYSAHRLYFFFVSPLHFSRSFLDFPFVSHDKKGRFEASSKPVFFEARFFCCPVLTDAECRTRGFTGVASGWALFSCLDLRVLEKRLCSERLRSQPAWWRLASLCRLR